MVPVIERGGFKATPNHRFTNPWTSSVEELDIFAIGGYPVVKDDSHFLFPIVLAECKNLSAPIVIFTQRELRMGVFLGMPHLSGLPLQVHTRQGRLSLPQFLESDTWHHYYRGARAGSQLCAVALRKESRGKPGAKLTDADYVAGHKVGEADLYETVSKLLAAVHAERTVHASSWVLGPRREPINLQAYYPTLITGGPLYECHLGARKPRYRRVHRLGFVFRRVDGRQVSDERIDVVDGHGLPHLLDAIERDMERMISKLRSHLPTLRRSINRTVSDLRSAGQETRIEVLGGVAARKGG